MTEADKDRRIAELETSLAMAVHMLDEILDYNQSGWSGPYSEDWKQRVARIKEGDARQLMPPCPTCGAPVHVDRIDVTAATDRDKVYVPGGGTRCTADHRHDVAAVARAWLTGPVGSRG